MSKEIIVNDELFLVSETDEKGIITFANDDFCKIAGYNVDEIIGKPHNIIRHKDMPKVAFKSLWDTIKKGEIWTGYVKNLSKSGDYYWVFATVYQLDMCEGKKGYLSCRRAASREEITTAENLYSEWIKLEK